MKQENRFKFIERLETLAKMPNKETEAEANLILCDILRLFGETQVVEAYRKAVNAYTNWYINNAVE